MEGVYDVNPEHIQKIYQAGIIQAQAAWID